MPDTDLIAVAFHRKRLARYIDSLRCTESLLAQLMEQGLLPDGEQFEQVLIQRAELTFIADTLAEGLAAGIKARPPEGQCCEWRGCTVQLSPGIASFSRRIAKGAFCATHRLKSLAAAKRHLPRP